MWESRKSPGLSHKPRFNRGFFISNLMLPSSVADLVRRYPAIPDPKSRELILMLLASTADPFSRHQFHSGHITCTGLVLAPDGERLLLVHHRRLDRWLLPGGHVEAEDAEIWDAARREVVEETGV